MPLDEYLQAAGFRVTATLYVIELSLDPGPDDLALRIRRGLLRHR